MIVRMVGLIAALALVAPAAASTEQAPTNGLLYYGSGTAGFTVAEGITPQPAQPDGSYDQTFNADGTTMAFKMFQTIFVSRGDGRDPVAVTPGDGLYGQGQLSLSPDGTRMAYQAGTFAGVTLIAVVNTDGSGQRVLVPPDPKWIVMNPHWSPTGDAILYTRLGWPTSYPAQTLTVDLNGASRLIANDFYYGSWSPDARRIVGIINAPPYGVATINADGSDRHPVTGEVNGVPSWYPTWSPDGREIAFVNGTQSIYSVSPDGSNLHLAAFGDSRISSLTWRPVSSALTVTTEDSLDNLVLAKHPIDVTFHVRSIGGIAVPDVSVSLQSTSGTTVSAQVGNCRLVAGSPCSIGTIAADSEVDLPVTIVPSRGGPTSVALVASSPSETAAADDNTSTLSTFVSPCTIMGTDGSDTLRASRAGGDLICAGGGADTIYARNGKRDTVDGGKGNDTAIVDKLDKVTHVEHVRRSR